MATQISEEMFITLCNEFIDLCLQDHESRMNAIANNLPHYGNPNQEWSPNRDRLDEIDDLIGHYLREEWTDCLKVQDELYELEQWEMIDNPLPMDSF